MKRLSLCLLLILGGLLLPTSAMALTFNTAPSLIISEIKVKNDTTTGGYNEFIELYNASVTSLNLNNFTIEYYNSPAPAETDQPIKKVIVADGMLLPAQTIVFATNTQQITNSYAMPFSSLADAGGLVRVRSLDDTVEDQIAWTSTSSLAISPVLFLSSSTTNKTKSFTRNLDGDGNPVLANPSWSLVAPTPTANTLLPVPTSSESEPTETTGESASEQPTNSGETVPTVTTETPVAQLQISELLPNPASPANDSTDEYIELYNPSNEAVDLTGYKLQSGNNFSYSYTFPASTLGAGEYKAFYVLDTGLLLANSGGKARLLDPSGRLVFEVSPYDEASAGSAWAYINGSWLWTTSPTPNASNNLTLPVSKAAKTAVSKTSAKAKASSAKVAGAKTSAKPKSQKTGSNSNTDETDQVAQVHPGIIAGVGLLAIGYAAYEYRFDVANRLFQLRRYREARAAARAKL